MWKEKVERNLNYWGSGKPQKSVEIGIVFPQVIHNQNI